MSSFINTNMSSLNAQRNLNTSQSQMQTSLQRLSSGLRINSAKDDAAGMAIASRFTTQINGCNQAARNANDAISLSQTAEGDLTQISNNLQRIRDLSVQSTNASNTASDRAAMNTEAQQLKSEIDRVATTSSFNGVKLLDGSFTSQDFQVGANAGEVISIASITNAQSNALGSTTVGVYNPGAAPAGVTSFATAVAAGAGAFTIQNAGGTAVDILPAGSAGLAAAASGADRIGQVKDAINAQSHLTGVAASTNATTGALELSSSHTITVAGASATAALTGMPVGAGAAAAATVGFGSLDISSSAGATMAIKFMDSAMSVINTARASIGAVQNRFSSVVTNLQTTSENLSASRSRIQDTDFAAETSALTRNQILQQAGTAMLAQANQMPNGVMALLR